MRYRVWKIAVGFVLVVGGCEKSSSLSTYQAVIANIRAGTQVIAPTGEIVLPPSQASSVERGSAYATTQPGGTLMVLFPTWWGKGDNLRGYLYSSGPALAGGASVSIKIPALGSPLTKQFDLVEVDVESVVSPGWYYVSRSLD